MAATRWGQIITHIKAKLGAPIEVLESHRRQRHEVCLINGMTSSSQLRYGRLYVKIRVTNPRLRVTPWAEW